MITHEEIEHHRNNPSITHAWDFCLAEGDTIREKYGKLQHIVEVCCVRSIEGKRDAYVIGTAETISGLWVSIDCFVYSP